MSAPSSGTTNDSSKDRAERLAEALARFKLASEAEAQQRTRELEDLRFSDFDEQWPDDVKKARDGYQPGGGLPPVPARPCLTINKLRQPITQTSNEARSAKLSLQFAPKGNGATRAVAEVFEDLARAIQADSRANVARQWAYDRAIKAGRGWYRLRTDYSNDGDFDQDVIYSRILNQSSVYVDPSSTEPDCSDAAWMGVVEDVPFERYKRQFPKSKLAKAGGHGQSDPGELTSIGDEQPDWVKSTESGGHVVRIAEYFYVEYNRETIGRFDVQGVERTVKLTDPSVAGLQPLETREIEVRSVKWCKLNAVEILEENEWPGRYIPIIPVIADEANVNGERRWTGLVRPAMDAQRSYNYMRSAQVEGVGLAPRAPWVGHAEVFEGYESWWAQANTRNFTYLPIKLVRDGSGAALPAPTRNVVEPAIQAITLAAHEADGDIKATTGRFDASLGNMSPGERSGKAILALQKQAEQGSSGWLDNLATMSMVYEGKILLDLIPAIYSRPGRILAAIGADDQRRSIMVGQPFVPGKDGLPQPVPPGQPPPPDAKMFDLAQGAYSVAVTIGKSYTTRREESVSMMGQLAEAAPQMVPLFADLWVGNMDFPGAKQIEDRLKKQLPPQFQEQEGGKPPLPPEVMQQMQQAQQVIDQLTGELNAKTQLIETEATKNQADLDRARLEIESKERIASLNSQTQIELERLKQEGAQAAATLNANLDYEKFRLTQLQAYNEQQMAQGHESGMQAQKAQDQRVQAADQAGYQQDAQAQGAEQQAALAEQAAALAPEPQGAGQ